MQRRSTAVAASCELLMHAYIHIHTLDFNTSVVPIPEWGMDVLKPECLGIELIEDTVLC